MDFKTLLLLGIAGYFAYRQFAGSDAMAVAQPAAPAAPPAPNAVAPVATTRDLMQRAYQVYLANGGPQRTGLLTTDEWNYFYAQVRGVPVNYDIGVSHDYRMSLDEWLQRVAPAGVSGLR